MTPNKQCPSVLYQKTILFMGICLVCLGIYSFGLRFYYAPSTATDLLEDYNTARAWVAGEQMYINVNNTHPPLLIMLVLPLSFLQYSAAIQVWNVLSLLGMVGLVILLLRLLEIPISRTTGILIIGVLLNWFPFHAHIAEGQVSIFLSLCLMGAWANLRQKQEIPAGILLGIAVHIKIFPVLFVLYLLLRRRYKAFIAMIVTILFLGSMLIFVLKAQNIWRYLSEILLHSSMTWAIFPANSSINGLLGRLFLSGPWMQPLINAPTIYSTFYILGGLAVLLSLSFDLWKLPHSKQGDDLAFGITCIIMLLLSPMTWSHSVILLLLPFCLLSLYSLTDDPYQRLILLLIFLAISLPDITIARALMAYNAPYPIPWYQALVFALPTLSFFLLWMMLRQIWKSQVQRESLLFDVVSLK